MSSLYSDIEIKIGKILAEHPEKKDNAFALFEEASGLDIEDDVAVHLHDSNESYSIVIPPSLTEVKRLLDDSNKLGNYFGGLYLDPNEKDTDKITIPQVIAAKAWSNEETMSTLKSSPKIVLNEMASGALPDDFSINFYQDSDHEVHLNIPPTSALGGELGAAELGQVTGGSGAMAMAMMDPDMITAAGDALSKVAGSVLGEDGIPGIIRAAKE